MDKVLVLGGTGAMGSYLIKELADRYHVVVTSRKAHTSTVNIEYVVGNAHNFGFVEKLLSKEHYTAIIDFMNYGTQEYSQKYMKFLDATEHYFYLSSSRVYADSSCPITEKSPRLLDVSEDRKFLATDDYALAKARQEDLLRKSGRTNWTIIRPYMSYFPNRLDLGYYSKEQWLYRIMHGRTIVFPQDVADSYTTLTHGKDVAKGIAMLVGKEDAKGEAFHITTDKAYKWSEIISVYRTALEKAGLEFKCKYIPEAEIKDNYIYVYDRVYNRRFDNNKIKHYLDTTDFVDPKDGIRECIEKYLQKPSFNNIDWIYQAYLDTLSKETTKLSEISDWKSKLKYVMFRYLVSYPLVHKIYQIVK